MRRLLLGSVSALLLVSPLASSASAESVTRTDARGDVRYCSYDGTSNTEPCAEVRDRPTVDLTGYRIAYGTSRLQVVLQYAELEPVGPTRFSAGTLLQYRDGSPERAYAFVEVQTTPDNRAGTSSARRFSDGRSCGARHLIDYERNRVTLTMGTACLGNPAYVLASVNTSLFDRTYSRGYVDTAPGDYDSDATVRVDRR